MKIPPKRKIIKRKIPMDQRIRIEKLKKMVIVKNLNKLSDDE